MKKNTIKTYNFDELNEEEKQRAREELAYINVKHNWYDCGIIEEIAKKYGLEVKINEIVFDLGRSNYCYFETYNHSQKENYEKGIRIANGKKFIEMAGIEYDENMEYDMTITHTHYAGNVGKNFINLGYEYDFSQEDENALQECLNEFIKEVLKYLKKEYDYLTSKEAVDETIKCNGWMFQKEEIPACKI